MLLLQTLGWRQRKSLQTVESTNKKVSYHTGLGQRRRRFAIAAGTLYLILVAWLAILLDPAGNGPVAWVILAAFAISAPWTVLGVGNSLLGYWLMHGVGNGLARVFPAADAPPAGPVPARTAILMTIRNEEPARAFSRLRRMKTSLDGTGEGGSFAWFILSDTNDPAIAAQEEAEFAAWRKADEAAALHYRRRTDNKGYKAGNIRDFCERWGADFDFMLTLDADSLMDGETILRLVRLAEAQPRLGILQSLVVGAPSRSAFARLFQFGMRSGMRTYTMGAAWWTGDCGPYWGHNALIRIQPFTQHCDLPLLSGGRHILSHDQVEAVLMRRAGYEVRVLPVESGSFEENPPTLPDFIRRDLRWCQGNMQYLSPQVLGLSGLLPVSRFQLIWAISMFFGAPFGTLMVVLAACWPLVLKGGPSGEGLALFYLVTLLLSLMPKLLGFADVLTRPGEIARYGGARRFLAGAVLETLFSFLLGTVTGFSVTLFLLGLRPARGGSWEAQARDASGLSVATAVRLLWPHTLFGLVVFALLSATPTLLLWSLPLTAGYLTAIPLALITASPRLGEWMLAARLCATPEEIDPPIMTLG